MQINKVDPLLRRIKNNVIQIKIAVDINRKRSGNFSFFDFRNQLPQALDGETTQLGGWKIKIPVQ